MIIHRTGTQVSSKNRIVVPVQQSLPQQQSQTFQHSTNSPNNVSAGVSRPVSIQTPRPTQQIQPRITQSPFSPGPQTPQSPHDQLSLSPANSGIDQFSRPGSECSQPDPYLNVRFSS